MSLKITLSGGGEFVVFVSHHHSDLIEASEYELQDVRQKFSGLLGEAELRDRPGGRDVVCQCTYFAATSLIINNAINNLNSYTNQVTGTLVMEGNLQGSWPHVTFKGFAKGAEGIRRDAAQNRYYCEGVLRFRQHRQS